MQEVDGPVAYTTDLNFDDQTSVIHETEKGKLGTWRNDIPLYTSPFAWRGLTKEEIAQGPQEVLPALYGRWGWAEKEAFEAVVAWAEAKLKEKNGG